MTSTAASCMTACLVGAHSRIVGLEEGGRCARWNGSPQGKAPRHISPSGGRPLNLNPAQHMLAEPPRKSSTCTASEAAAAQAAGRAERLVAVQMGVQRCSKAAMAVQQGRQPHNQSCCGHELVGKWPVWAL